MHLKKGDNIIVITGKDRGKTGKIVRAFPKDNKVVVEGINTVKRHERARRQGTKGQTVTVSMPIHASNLMIADPKTGKPSRFGQKMVGEKKVRVTKKSGSEI